MPVRFRLQQVIDEKGETQSGLARKTGIAFSTISKMCRNKSAQVSLATLDSICRALNVQPGELLEADPPIGQKKKR